ncbi:MAG: hypothetical protein ABIB11_06195 [Candidatus Omnitrophota bacterium]
MSTVFDPYAPPIFKPDEIKGCYGNVGRTPDRYFYILYGEEVLECDGYKIGDNWSILLICPVCKGELKIDSIKKHMQMDERGLELAETIKCSWPGDFGQHECTFCVALEPPRKTEDKIVVVNGRKVKIDAVAKKA